MAELLLQFSTSTAWTSAIIRRLTQSDFSHVDIVVPGEGLLGVSGKDNSLKWSNHTPKTDIGGVLIRPFGAWDYLYPPKIAHVQCNENVAREVILWARAQIDRPFDNGALYAFLRDRAGLPKVGRDWRDPDKWFCSEFVIRALEVGGLFPYTLITPKDTVSPNTLLCHINPYLPLDNILEFIS